VATQKQPNTAVMSLPRQLGVGFYAALLRTIRLCLTKRERDEGERHFERTWPNSLESRR